MKSIWIFALIILTSCASAEQKPEKKWEVKVSTKGEPKVWVSKLDGSKQCEPNSAQFSPEEAAKALKSMGILVYQFRSGNDGMMRTAVCGASTGNTVDLEISRKDLAKAQAQGFQPMKTQN